MFWAMKYIPVMLNAPVNPQHKTSDQKTHLTVKKEQKQNLDLPDDCSWMPLTIAVVPSCECQHGEYICHCQAEPLSLSVFDTDSDRTRVVLRSKILLSSQGHLGLASLDYTSWPKTSTPIGGIREHSLLACTLASHSDSQAWCHCHCKCKSVECGVR